MDNILNDITKMDMILCKAKRIDNGEWVIGYFYRLSETQHPFIMLENKKGEVYEIDENTLCRFTGLKTKQGKMVWEYDKVKYHFGDEIAPIRFGIYQSCFDNTKTQHCGFYVDWGENTFLRKDLGYWINMVDTQIIGNEDDEWENNKI